MTSSQSTSTPTRLKPPVLDLSSLWPPTAEALKKIDTYADELGAYHRKQRDALKKAFPPATGENDCPKYAELASLQLEESQLQSTRDALVKAMK